jgi:ABC-type dipeptide/oligopeptide/nickel transport system permease component
VKPELPPLDVGRPAVASTVQRVYPRVIGITQLISALVIASNLLVDVVYGRLDPLIRVGEQPKI